MSVQSPADRRFRRARVTPARRRRVWTTIAGRFLRALVALGLLASGAYWGSLAVVGSSRMRIDSITVDGNKQLSDGAVLALLDGLRGEHILLADLARFRSRLLESSWVADAALRRLLPSTVEVRVAERAPIGLGRVEGRLYLVDADGIRIDEFGPRYARFDLPIIDGLAPSGSADATLNAERAQLAASLLSAVGPRADLAKRISQIDVRDVRNAVVIFKGDSTLVHVGRERFVERLEAYLDLAPALREHVPSIDYVDVRFEERVYVRPAGEPGAKPRRF